MNIQHAVSLKDRNTLGFDVAAEYFAQGKSLDDLNEAIAWAKQKSLPVFALGGGSNLVLTRAIEGLVLAVETRGIDLIDQDADSVTLEIAAGENWHQLVLYCCVRGYHGIENLALIPGSAGAAPIQNIGAYGVEFGNVFDSLDAISLVDGRTHTFSQADCQFAYRDSFFKRPANAGFIILRVRLRLEKNFRPHLEHSALQNRIQDQRIERPDAQQMIDLICAIRRSKLPDPTRIGNAGSFFTNPLVDAAQHRALKSRFPALVSHAHAANGYKLAAGWMIEHCGWKGYRENGVGVHPEQALVLVNQGTGSGESLMALANKIKASVLATFGVRLEIEPLVV